MGADPGVGERDAQVLGPGRGGQGVLEADQPVLDEIDERLLQRLHAVVLAVAEHLLELVESDRVGDAVDDLGGAGEDLDRRRAALAVGPLQQALADDPAEGGDERLAGLAPARPPGTGRSGG